MLLPMRVLTVCLAAPGHANPLVPLVTALADRDCEVLVASGAAVRGAFEPTGARFADVGSGFEACFGRLAARIRGMPGDGLPPEHIERYFVPRLFAEIIADDMIDGLLEHGRQFQPDVVLVETLSLAAPLVAKVLDVPLVHHQVGLLHDPLVLELATDAISPLWRTYGFDVPPDAGLYSGLTLRTIPPSLDPTPIPRGDVLDLRPVPLPLPRAADDGRRPLVHVTLGTIMNTDIAVFHAAIDGLASEPVDVLVTVGNNNDPALLDPLPANTRVERYVSHAELLPQCAAVVHHGGTGTMLGCCAHGLPQVVIPQGGDQFRDGAALAGAGAAEVLLPGDVTATTVREAVSAVLHAGSYAEAAGRIAAEIAAMPSADDVVAELCRRFAKP